MNQHTALAADTVSNDNDLCSRCNQFTMTSGSQTFDDIDLLEWYLCTSCGNKGAVISLVDGAFNGIKTVLEKNGIPRSDSHSLGLVIDRTYNRNPFFYADDMDATIGQNDVDIAWKVVKDRLPLIYDSLGGLPEVASPNKIPADHIFAYIEGERGIACRGQFNIYIEWPLRVLEAMGWIGRSQDEIWRLI